MAYWKDQPMNISENNDIKIITTDILREKKEILPDGFKFKTLNMAYLDEIHSLLNNHYVEDDSHIVRLMYSKDFIYWYLKKVPPGLLVGLVYKNKLVGMITAIFIDLVISGKTMNLPYINFLCVQSKIRNYGLAIYLTDEIKYRLAKNNFFCLVFTSMKTLYKSFSKTKDFIIPINHAKLKSIGFLTEDLPPYPEILLNPLQKMSVDDIKYIAPKLNKFMKKYEIAIDFTQNTVENFLLPKKNIVYSYVIKNSSGEITDFVSVYKHYLYCVEKKAIVSVAQLAFYYYDSITLTELITFLIDKLADYNFDQLVFRDFMDNSTINITRFGSHAELNYYFYNFSMKKTEPNKLCFYPF